MKELMKPLLFILLSLCFITAYGQEGISTGDQAIQFVKQASEAALRAETSACSGNQCYRYGKPYYDRVTCAAVLDACRYIDFSSFTPAQQQKIRKTIIKWVNRATSYHNNNFRWIMMVNEISEAMVYEEESQNSDSKN